MLFLKRVQNRRKIIPWKRWRKHRFASGRNYTSRKIEICVNLYVSLSFLLSWSGWTDQQIWPCEAELTDQQSAGWRTRSIGWEEDSPLCQSCQQFCLLIYVAWLAPVGIRVWSKWFNVSPNSPFNHIGMPKESIISSIIWPTAHEEG